MKNIRNILKSNEKLSMLEMIGHDANNHLMLALSGSLDEKMSLNYGAHFNTIFNSVVSMTRDKMVLKPVTKSEMDVYFNLLNTMLNEEYVKDLPVNISFENNLKSDFCSYDDLLYSVFYNLGKNPIKAFSKMEKSDKSKTLNLKFNLDEYYGLVKNVLIASEHSKPVGGFIKLSVEDDGLGFSKENSLRTYFDKGVSSNGGGLGLYFVSTICRYLKSHLVVKSEPGKTLVEIYHPANIK